MGYTQNCEIWHGAFLGTVIIIKEKPICMILKGPCFGHKRAIFWPFLQKGVQDTPSNVKFGMEHPWAH